MGADFLNVLRSPGLRHQMMGDFLKNLPIDQEVGIDKHVEGMVHHTLCRILDRDHAKIGTTPLHFAEHFLDAVDRHILRGRAKLLRAGHMGERRPRSKVGHLLRTFQRQRRRHDLPVDGANGIGRERTGILGDEPLDNGGLARGRMQVRPGILQHFQSADLNHTFGTLVEET
jgi:hypothetical protein